MRQLKLQQDLAEVLVEVRAATVQMRETRETMALEVSRFAGRFQELLGEARRLFLMQGKKKP